MKKIILLLIILVFCQCSQSQNKKEKVNNEEVNINQYEINKMVPVKDMMNFYSAQDIDKLTKMVILSYEMSSKVTFDSKIEVIYIFNYGYSDNLSKNFFSNNLFYKKLIPSKLRLTINDNAFLNAQLLFKGENNKLIGIGDAFIFYQPRKDVPESLRFYQFILDKKEELSIVHLFHIDNFISNKPIFGLTEDGITYVFENTINGSTIKSIKDFIDTRPDKKYEKWSE